MKTNISQIRTHEVQAGDTIEWDGRKMDVASVRDLGDGRLEIQTVSGSDVRLDKLCPVRLHRLS